MRAQGGNGFFPGMLLGMVLSIILGGLAIYILILLEVLTVSMIGAPSLQDGMTWVVRNLGLSVIPFAVVLACYAGSLHVLATRLQQESPVDKVARLDHLVDIWTSLFFGIGVIWTAIGMRSALLFALGSPEDAAQAGAFEILRRLVDGGILTALTTTIVGGAGGYLMRVGKSFILGSRLARYYEAQDRHHGQRIEQLLRDIHESVASLGDQRVLKVIEGTKVR